MGKKADREAMRKADAEAQRLARSLSRWSKPEQGQRYGIQVDASGMMPEAGIMYYDGKRGLSAYPHALYATSKEAQDALQDLQQRYAGFRGPRVRIVEIKYQVKGISDED